MSSFNIKAHEDTLVEAPEWSRTLKVPAWIEFIHNVDSSVWQRPMHMHDTVEISYIVSGKGLYRINNADFPFEAGNIAVVEGGYMHETLSDDTEPLDFWVVRVMETGFPSIAGVLGHVRQGAYPVIASGAHGQFIEQTFLEMQRIYRHKDTATYELCQLLLTSMLAVMQHLYKDIPQHFQAPEKVDLPQQVAAYILNHYCEDLSLMGLAEQFHVSPSHLSCEFSKAFNISPINYVIDLRFQQARTLLMHSDMSVKVVSASVGYANVHHFNNLFLKRIGCLPVEFRERFQN